MRRLYQHIAPFMLLVLLLLANQFQSYSQGIELNRVSIAPGGGLQISYDIDGESNIDNLNVRFYNDLYNLSEYETVSILEHEEPGQPIPFPEGIDGTSQIHVRLDVTFADESSYRSNIHSAIFLESIESLSEACEYTIKARWSNYAIYPPLANGPQYPPIFNEVQLFMYRFNEENNYCIINDQPIFTIPQQPLGNSEEVIDLSDLDDLSGGIRYCFRVRAINNESNIESYSNMLKPVELEELARPDRVEITSVDVINNEAIAIKADVNDYGYSIFEYRLQRSDNRDHGFEVIDSSTHSTNEITFFDEDIPDFESNPWYYRVVGDMKDCPMDSPMLSDILSSVFLKADVNFAFGSDNEVEIILEWDHYFIDGNYDYTLIKQVSGGTPTRFSNLSTNSYTDALQLDQLGAEVKYIVEATRTGSMNPPVHSNYFLFSPEWLKPPPNAFRPGSSIEVNQKFTPEFYFETGIENYSLSIFDRNGLRLYYTEQTGEGWDGDIQATGQPAPEGAYIYEIRFDRADKPVRGVVYLVR